MATAAPPAIFSPARRRALRRRMQARQAYPDAARFLFEDMAEDLLERLAFLRHAPARALLIGDVTGQATKALAAQGCTVTRADPAPPAGMAAVDQESPLALAGFDLIATMGTLDTVNDLPGALIHLRRALAEGGLMVASFCGAGSLPLLRAVLLAADDSRPAGRLHPQVDVRAGGQLLQRAGFADPVIDSRGLAVRYRSLARLVDDLRDQGLGNALARPAPAGGKAWLARAEAAFAAAADTDGRATETFALLTLSGWARPLRAPKF